jgi:hypothetical protein
MHYRATTPAAPKAPMDPERFIPRPADAACLGAVLFAPFIRANLFKQRFVFMLLLDLGVRQLVNLLVGFFVFIVCPRFLPEIP